MYPLASAAKMRSLGQESRHPSMVRGALGDGMKLARRRSGAALDERRPWCFQPGNVRSGDGGMAEAAARQSVSSLLKLNPMVVAFVSRY